jgi:hypothetical protein
MARETCPAWPRPCGTCKSATETQIVSNGIRWNDLFHGDPEAARFEERFASFLEGLPSDEWRAEWRRSRAITEGTVALAGHYDILDAGGNGPYPTASAGYMVWVRSELAKSGASPPHLGHGGALRAAAGGRPQLRFSS